MISSDRQPLVLMLHTDYRFRGGEEESLEAEALCFEELGFRVAIHRRNNSAVVADWRNGLRALFDTRSFKEIWRTAHKDRPDLVYANNLWPTLSPSVLLAVRLLRIPTIQALRNYRLVAPSARLDDTGKCFVCHTRRHPFGCIIHGCYRSVPTSLTCAAASLVYRAMVLGWKQHWYLTPSQVSRDLLVKNGIPARRFLVRKNFLPFSSDQRTPAERRNVVSYVGRLSEEKGIAQLIRTWPPTTGFPTLEIYGDGPLRSEVCTLSKTRSHVEFRGKVSSNVVLERMGTSLFTVVPSYWAEPFGRVALESMSVGTPVMTTGNGALAEIVGETGIMLDDFSLENIESAMLPAMEPDAHRRLSSASYDRFWQTYSLPAAKLEMLNILRAVGVGESIVGGVKS